MKVNVREKAKNKLKIEIIGEGHTFCNALHSVLLKDSTVEFVGYGIAHPLVAQPILHVRTKGRRRPENAMIDAAKALGKDMKGFQEALESALKKEERLPSNAKT